MTRRGGSLPTSPSCGFVTSTAGAPRQHGDGRQGCAECAPRARQSSGPEHPDAKATVNALFGILDNPEMVMAFIALASDGHRLLRGMPESDEGSQCSF